MAERGKLAEAFVQITADDRKFDQGVAGVKGKLAKLAAMKFNVPGGGFAALLGGAGLAAGLTRSIKGAGDLAETVSKVEQVFGGASGKVTGFTDKMAEAFGTPKREMLDAQAMFGLIAQGMNKTKDESADLANSFSKLAADAASFHNTDLPTALEKIRAGLTGESEPLKAWGILIDEDRVKAEALALGLAKNSKEIDNNAKFMARASLITKGLATANGDLDRTIGGTNNQAKKFWGMLQNLSDTIGKTMLPLTTSFLGLLNQIGTDLSSSADKGSSSWSALLAMLKSGVEGVSLVYNNWGLIIERTGVMVGGAFQNMVEYVDHLRATTAAFLDWFSSNWKDIINDTVMDGTKALMSLIEMMSDPQGAAGRFLAGEISGEGGIKNMLLGGYNPATDRKTPPLALPQLKLSSVAGQLADIDGRMGARAQGAAGVGGKGVPAAVPGGAGAGGAGAAVKNLITDPDSYDRELREAGVNAKEDQADQKKIADEAAEHTKLLGEIRDTLKNGGNGEMMLGRWAKR